MNCPVKPIGVKVDEEGKIGECDRECDHAGCGIWDTEFNCCSVYSIALIMKQMLKVMARQL